MDGFKYAKDIMLKYAKVTELGIIIHYLRHNSLATKALTISPSGQELSLCCQQSQAWSS